MRRILVVLLVALCGLPLVAAAPSVLTAKPSVIVFPFTANGSSIDREASSRLATIIATQMANTGTVAVIAPPPGTERKDFLSVARRENADYYIAGFISSLGTGVSVVEQVVSTTSGIVVFSNTAQLQTYADAAGQGDDLALFVSRHANRGLAAIGTPPPAVSPTPAPTAEAQANLGKLFGRRKKTAPAAQPSPKATPVRTAAPAPISVTPTPRTIANVPPPLSPSTPVPPRTTAVAAAPRAAASGLAVLPVGGSADAVLRDGATERIASRAGAEKAATAEAACAERPHEAVLSGSLAIRNDSTFGGASATFDLIAKTCDGKTLWNKSYTNDAGGAPALAAQLAMERVVDAAIGAYLNPPKRRR